MSAMIRPLSLIGAFVVGWFFPQGAALKWIIPWTVGFMLFMTFLGLNFHKIRIRASHIAIVVLNVLAGVLGYKLVAALSGDHELALAAFFTCMAPTATAAPAIASFLKREVEYIATGLMLTTFVVMLTLPLLLPWALEGASAREGFLSDVLDVARSVALTMVVPIALARVWRAAAPSAAAWPKRFKNVTFTAWVFMVTVIACRASAFIRDPANGVGPQILLSVGAISLLACVFNFTVGYLIGEKRYRPESSQTLGQKNTAVMIAFATLYAGPLAALGPTLYVLWHNLWNAAQLAWQARADSAAEERAARE